MARTPAILLVEDDPTNQKVLRYLIEANGLTCEIVNNGVEALESIRRGTEFLLILMDLRIPELDGFATTRIIRASGNNVPIVAVTACAFADDKEKCLGSGMNDYLAKPFSKEQFDEILNQWIKLTT